MVLKYIFFTMVFLSLLSTSVLGVGTNSKYCFDANSTNSTYSIVNEAGETAGWYLTNCSSGCSTVLNGCRPDMFMQIIEVSIITILFFGMMVFGSKLSMNVPFLDVLLNILLVIFSTIIAVTNIFDTFSGIFWSEALLFFGIGVYFLIRNVWGD